MSFNFTLFKILVVVCSKNLSCICFSKFISISKYSNAILTIKDWMHVTNDLLMVILFDQKKLILLDIMGKDVVFPHPLRVPQQPEGKKYQVNSIIQMFIYVFSNTRRDENIDKSTLYESRQVVITWHSPNELILIQQQKLLFTLYGIISYSY